MATQSLLISYIIVLAQAEWYISPFQAEMGVQSLPPHK